MINDDDFNRYIRQIQVEGIGEGGQAKLSNASVLIIGCGGLGVPAATYLAAAGVNKMVLVDDDSIEVSNLHRQVAFRNEDVGAAKVESLKRSLLGNNPGCRVRTVGKRIEGAQLAIEISMADIVLDCTDNIKSRQQINKACFEHKKPLVFASAIGWQGQFAIFDYSDDSACYRCIFPFDSLPDGNRCVDSGIVGPVVGIMGTQQALAALRILTQQLVSSEIGCLKLFDGTTMNWRTLKAKRNINCTTCGEEQ